MNKPSEVDLLINELSVQVANLSVALASVKAKLIKANERIQELEEDNGE